MIELAHAFDINITLDPPQEFGDIPTGNRRIINITGGHVKGPKLTGKVLRGGADWQLVWRDGTAFLDARYTIEAEDDALIYIENKGFRHGPTEVLKRIATGEPVDPSEYYMRTAATLETAAPQYEWMNHTIFVATGARLKSSVELSFYEVL